jgi:ethanolamine utilization protein EutA
VIEPTVLAKAIRSHFTSFDLIEGATDVALALRWQGAPSYERIAAFAEGIRHGLANTIEHRKPIYIMLDGDIAQTLGAILREELLVESEILAIDGVMLRDFDYIDLGRIRMPSYTVPVTIMIKSTTRRVCLRRRVTGADMETERVRSVQQ